MTLPLARAAAPLVALLVFSAALLTGCSGDEPDSSDDEPTTSESSDSAEPSESATSDEPTEATTEETTDAPTSNEGCDLITPEEAEEILGGPLEDPLESPPSIECQYVPIAGGRTLDLYRGDAATTVIEAQEGADTDFAREPVDGVGEEAEVMSFAGCGGVYFRTSDGTWWYLTTVCDSDKWESETRPAMIDLATTIVARLES